MMTTPVNNCKIFLTVLVLLELSFPSFPRYCIIISVIIIIIIIFNRDSAFLHRTQFHHVKNSKGFDAYLFWISFLSLTYFFPLQFHQVHTLTWRSSAPWDQGLGLPCNSCIYSFTLAYSFIKKNIYRMTC